MLLFHMIAYVVRRCDIACAANTHSLENESGHDISTRHPNQLRCACAAPHALRNCLFAQISNIHWRTLGEILEIFWGNYEKHIMRRQVSIGK